MNRRFVVIVPLSVLSILVSASHLSAGSMTWQVCTNFIGGLELRFYAPDRNHVWPNAREVWNIPENQDTENEYAAKAGLTDEPEPKRGAETIAIECIDGEKVCYGARPPMADNFVFGVGLDGDLSCKGCCYSCQGQTTPIIRFLLPGKYAGPNCESEPIDSSTAACLDSWIGQHVTVSGTVGSGTQHPGNWSVYTAGTGPAVSSSCNIASIYGTGELSAACQRQGSSFTVSGQIRLPDDEEEAGLFRELAIESDLPLVADEISCQ